MLTALITSFLLLAAIIYAVYRRQASSDRARRGPEHALPPQTAQGWSGLFGEEIANQHKQLASAGESDALEQERARILARAAGGERSALIDARATNDAPLYDAVLDTLVGQISSDKALLALVSYMLREEPAFRINRRLAAKFMEAWKQEPDRGSTAKMLHVVALADEAGLYREAIEMALEAWRAGLIADLSAEELRSLSESEYWILSQQERSSGQGFLLKLKLAALRRELARGPRAHA